MSVKRMQFANMSPKAAFWSESAGLGVAEFASAAVALGVIGYADKIAPNMVKSVSNEIAKHVILPHLEFFEKTLGTVCRLDSCKPDYQKSREERAYSIARATVLFGGAWLPSFAVKVAVRRGINESMGLGDNDPWYKIWKWNDHDKRVAGWDESIHYGSMFVMNTLLPKPTDVMIEHTSSMIQKIFGWDKKRADETALMAVAHEIPNALGFAAGMGAIAHERFKGSHVDALKTSSSLTLSHI